MKIFVEYNEEGRIRSVTLPAAARLKDNSTIILRLLPSPGHYVAELEAEHIKAIEELVKGDEYLEELNNIKYEYQVEGHPHRPHLLKKFKE